MRAIVYLRVSTDQQSASGLGLAAQESACRAHCARLGYAVSEVLVDDGISGTEDLSGRPGLARAVELTRQRKDVALVVYSLSRLSRRQSLTWALLEERGEYALQLVSATEPFETVTAFGRAMLGMLAIFASLESDMASERTKAALAAKRARGERLGKTPLCEAHPEIAKIVRDLAQTMRPAEVARELTRRGVSTLHGRTWHRSTVTRMLAQGAAETPL